MSIQFLRTPTYSQKARRSAGLLSCRIIVCSFLLTLLLFASSVPAAADSVRNRYLEADRALQSLQKDAEKRKFRSHWENLAKDFESAWATDPLDTWAPAALYRAAETHLALSRFSGRASDQEKAADLFRRVFHECPKSRYKFRAIDQLKELGIPLNAPVPQPEKTPPAPPPAKIPKSTRPEENALPPVPPSPEASALPVVLIPTPSADLSAKPAPQAADSTENNPALGVIRGVRYQTYPNRTRLVVDADREIPYAYNDLNRDKEKGLPPRVYVDFSNTTLAADLPSLIQIDDPQIKVVRIARNTHDKVRLVMDLDKSRDFKIFQLFDPHRTVIDVWGESRSSDRSDLTASLPAAAIPPLTPPPGNLAPGAIRRQLALGVHRIVIDPGHGGKDPGAIGQIKGVFEKNINLEIARKLAEKLKKELKCEVLLTRTGDTYLALEERTQFANQHKADLFISIHTNAALSRSAHGLETYFLNLATDEESIAVAARENATSTKNISDLQTILNDLMQNAKINESSRLASYVQRGMVDSVRPHYSKISDKGVKQAPFYVLLGAQMPSVLIETGFVTHPTECQRLTNAQYQNRLTDGIVDGVRRYIQDHFPKGSPGKK